VDRIHRIFFAFPEERQKVSTLFERTKEVEDPPLFWRAVLGKKL
jgi:hypothetical protein